MTMTKEQRLQGVHSRALEEFDRIATVENESRELSLGDRRFYSIAGAQWEGAVGEQFANRPKIEVNKIHLAVIKIFNEYRNNRVSAQFISKTGEESDELADLCAGLYRADQQDSGADAAYDNAFEEAVGGGFGAWRLRAEYEDEYDDEDDRQRIRFEPIYDADSTVYFDINSKRQDKSDAKHCFVLTGMTREAYIDEWDDDPETWSRTVTDASFDWNTPDLVYVAEYYVVDEVTEKVYTYKTISGDFEKYTEAQLTDELAAKLNNIGTIRVSVKPVKRRKVRKYILSGGGVLEDCGFIAGKHIPVIPMFGKRWYIDGKERFMGHVRLVKDAQRLKNMQLSVLAETAAMGGIETPIFTPEQIAGHENTWAGSAVEKPAYLLLNSMTDANGNEIPSGPVGYTKPPQVPQAMAALLQISDQDIGDLLGNQDQGDEIQSNLSGKAVELIQNRLDMQSFIYMSNFGKAEQRCAEVWLGMASELYADDNRKMKVVDEQDQVEFVEMGRRVLGDDGKPQIEADIANAKFDITIDIGPTSASKRSSTVRALTQMLPLLADPQDQKVVSAFALMNMEGEGISQINKYFRKQMVEIGVIEPTDEEAKDMADAKAQQKPDPNAVYLEAEARKADAQAIESKADTTKALADAEYAKARAAKTLAEISNAERDSVTNAVAKLSQNPQPIG